MFGWFKRTPKPDDASLREEMQKIRLELEHQRLILEALDKDLLIDVVESLSSLGACRRLVEETPSVAANLIHLQSRVWHNASQILSTLEASGTH